MKIEVRQQYHELIPGKQYTLVSEGFDHKTIKLKGTVKCVPKWVFEGKIHRKYTEVEEIDDEDYLMMEY